MFGALGLRVISTLLGLLLRSTPLKVSIFTTFRAGEEGTLNLPILHHSYLYGAQGQSPAFHPQAELISAEENRQFQACAGTACSFLCLANQNPDFKLALNALYFSGRRLSASWVLLCFQPPLLPSLPSCRLYQLPARFHAFSYRSPPFAVPHFLRPLHFYGFRNILRSARR